ncbi:MAG: ABC transporter ATP-binding protein [Bacteroidota bacterium]
MKFLADEIKTALRNDPINAAGHLVEFAMEHALDNKLVHQALILKMNLSENAGNGGQEPIVNDMISLVDKISAAAIQNDQTANAGASLPVRKKRHLPVRQNDIVCKGTGLNKAFKRNGFALRDIDVSFRLGEITGVVGENGNGKTTLFRLIIGDLALDAGTIDYPYIREKAGIFPEDWTNIKKHIAFIPQDLDRWFGSVRNNLHYELSVHSVYGQKNDDEVDYIIHRLGLEEHQDKTWGQLSGGYKLRFALARALVWKPKLLVIDEPLANLDIKAQLVILNDLRDLANGYRYPLSIVISSQHLHEIESVSDNIIFLRNGNMVFNGRVDDLGNEREENTYEFGCGLTQEELEKKLKGLSYYGIENTGLAFVIRTPLSVTHDQLLKKLLEENVNIEYFRNISQSTKKLFV